MLTATPELVAFLNATTVGVSLPVLTLTLRDGTVLRWARHTEDVTFGGVTWAAHGRGGRPLVLALRPRSPIGLSQIGMCEVRLGCDDTTVLGSRRFTLAAAQGAFDDAKLLVERVYRATPTGAVVGKLFRFAGDVLTSPPHSHGVTLSAQSAVAKMKARAIPKTLVSSACGDALGDVACGVNLAAHRETATVAAGSTRSVVQLTGSWAAGYWDLGSFVVTSGALAGERRGVRASSGGAITLTNPLPAVPAAGVGVTLTRGCDHTLGAGGCAKFANLPRFRGMPHIPKES